MWKYPLKYAPEHTIPHWKTKKLHTVGGGGGCPPPTPSPLGRFPPSGSVASLTRKRFSGNLECSLWHLCVLTHWRQFDFALTCISHRPQPEYNLGLVSGQLPTGTIPHRTGIGPDEWFYSVVVALVGSCPGGG